MEKQIEEQKETLDELGKTENALRGTLKEIDRFLSNELCIDLEKAIGHEEGALQSKKIKLQETTRLEEKEKEHVKLLKEKLETTLQKIETLSKDKKH